MKNLVVHTHSTQDLSDKDHADLREILNSDVLCCTNPDNDDLYVLRDKSLYQISSVGDVKISKVDINIDNQAESKPVGLEYSSDVNQLWCAYASGNIVAVNAEPELQQDVTNHIQGGLRCIKLSPDQEILVSITADDTVVTTVSDFHIVSQVDLNAADYGKNQFITVGWGKKETQFHGTEGKAAAKAKTIVVGKTEDDDGLPRITWRGDGSMFAVSFLHKEKDARLFKVFNREGVLQCTSELTNGLEPHISWKPSGNIIATSQLFPNKHVIAFFEKNGLKHRELCLPFKPNEIDIINMQWSYDSEVLSVWFKNRNTGNTSLQLWTENNYHWYLKQTIELTEKNPLLYYTWSAVSRAGKRLILLSREKLTIYTFRWSVNHCWDAFHQREAAVGVIDGKRILLTRFEDGIVPPPMAHQTIEMDKTINSMIFGPRIISSHDYLESFSTSRHEMVELTFLCLLSNNRLVLCQYFHHFIDRSRSWSCVTYEITWKTDSVINDNETYTLHHFLWLKPKILLCSAASSTGSYLCLLDIEPPNESVNGRAVISATWLIDGPIEHIVSCPDENEAYVIANKRVLKYVYGLEPSPTDLEIPESCCRVEVIKVSERQVVVSLTSRGRFFIDGNETASNITSFAVHSDFLLLTTMQHTLISVRLDEEGFRYINDVLTVKPWENGCPEKNSLSLNVRRVERGSNLIIAIPGESKTILQMPRGNLECIQPRALSLHIIGARLDNLNYTDAFDMMRKQRINLNVIYDHNPSLFTKNAEEFVDYIDNPAWLSLFLSELQEDNVMETIYKNSHRGEITANLDPVEAFYREHKVERVCKLLRTIMEARSDANRFIQPILTSLVKNQQIPGLEAALRKVKEVRAQENNSNDDNKKQGISSEEALKYLLYLVHVHVLFDIAMGMYDFELALFVASKSQKDPKEYIPLINDLKQREENYMKYSIDKHLKRYNSALNHITKAPDKFSECLEFICNHNMYARALKIYPRQSDEYREIARIYGDVLMKSDKYYEAGIMFTRSRDLKSAVCAFKAAGSWQDAIVVGTQLDLGPQDMQEFYQDLVSHLSQDRKYRDAAEILVTYLKQHEDAVSMLCEGKEWRDAMRIAYSMKRLDLIETHVKPGVQEHAGYLLFKINKSREDYDKQKTRLTIVRQENAARDLRMQESLGADYDYSTGREVSDLLSETSSVTGSHTSQSSRSSRSSGRTYRSSKNRRKQERKVLSIKEGSLFEDLALIRALHMLITSVYADKDEVKLVTQMLLNFDLDDIAEKLQSFFGELLNFIERTKHEIWPKCAANDPLETREVPIGLKENQRGNIPQSLLEPCFMYPPEAGTSAWQKDIFHQSNVTN